MRSAAAKMLGKSGGASVTARLAANRCDPNYEVALKLVKTWASAIWDQQVEVDVMEAAGKQAAGKPDRAKRQAACGAVGAYHAALQLAGWRAPSHAVVITRNGTPLNLTADAPRTVTRHLREDWEAASAARASHPHFASEAAKYVSCSATSTEYRRCARTRNC